MKTITTPDFIGRIAKIVEEVSARAYVEEIDTEGIKEILQEELKECYAELKEYYEEIDEYCIELDGYYAELKEYYDTLAEYYEDKYYSTINSARNSAYYDGYDDGYAAAFRESFCGIVAHQRPRQP